MSTINELIKKRGIYKGAITRINNWYTTNHDIEKNHCQFEIRLEHLTNAFSNYNDVQENIESLDPDDKDRDQAEDTFFNAHAQLKNKINSLLVSVNASLPSSPSNVTSQPVPQIRLPEIHIKIFKGEISEWTSFHQLFTALVSNNPSLCDIQKFMYLKSFLKDEPLKLIDTLAVTNENFATAINILKNRYENKNSVINSHLLNLLDTPAITKCNAQNLRDFVTNCKRNVESLKNLNLSFEELWNLIIVHLLERKLDFVSKKAFESGKNLDTLPVLQEFFEFLDKRCTILENLSSLESNTFKKPHNVSFHLNNSNVNTEKCLFCNEAHKIYACTKFRSLQISERHNFIKSNKFCFNCLGSKHQANECQSLRHCSVCAQKHHSLLHFVPNHNNAQTNNQNSHNNTAPYTNTRQTFSRQIGNPPRSQVNNNRNNLPQGQNFLRPITPQSVTNPISNRNSQTFSTNHNFSPNQSGNISQNVNLNAQNNPDVSQSLSATSIKTSHILLATASVYIYNAQGVRISARVLLDNGSQNSFITKNLVDTLQLQTYDKKLLISGISQTGSTSNAMTDLTLYSKVNPQQRFKLSCAVLTNITCKLPQVRIDMSKLHIPQNVQLADPEFGNSQEINILIGADLYYNLLLNGIIRLGKNLPVLQETHLGWVVAGCIPHTAISSRNEFYSHASLSVQRNIRENVSLFLQTDENFKLDNLIEKFWTVEDLPQKTFLPPKDEQSESIFLETTKILYDGRYQVNLPLKTSRENEKLGDSFYIAKRRFLNLERKFEKNLSLKCDYSKFIDDYVELGHARYVPLSLVNVESENHEVNKYFFPHHAVFRENSVSSKIRIVFDGSCKTSSGLCLNDVTLKGFQVQPDLYDILCRFRSFNFVLISDIEKMYRQINVNPNQCFLLNILWRKNPDEDLKCIELSTVTYGTNCAPYLATRVLNDIAIKNSETFPLASDALLKQTYVDDIIYGCDSQSDLEKVYVELNSLLNHHGFQLHKWCSNSQDFLKKISQDKTLKYDLNFDDSPNSVLGLKWDPISDVFTFSPPETLVKNCLTKRNILSTIAKMYDPLGLVSCVVVLGKLIMQKLWLLKIDWDTKVTDPHILELWNNFMTNIGNLAQIKISRNLFLNKSKSKIQLHGFADASTSAYAACSYIRTLYSDGTVSSNLISSKSRVAPLKTISLPRLELCAMLLLSKLIENMLSIYESKFAVDSVHLWTDSTIALCWIQAHASRWSVFVSNRVSQIQDLTSKFNWRHVDTKNNPADLPSRGILPQYLVHCSFWFQGPEFLLKNENFDLLNVQKSLDLVNPTTEIKNAILSEEKKVSPVSLHIRNELDEFWNRIFAKFSKFATLQRVAAYCLRFANNTKAPLEKFSGPLSIHELENALNLILKVIQNKYFSKEIAELQDGKPLTNKNLLPFKPFLCKSDNFLRVGGRLENAEISFDQKHPILLPAHNNVVTLMLAQEHKRLGHAGAQTVLSNFRLKFWPLNGLKEIKRVIRNCITCYRFRAEPAQQIMSDLPKDRVQICRPFQKVGVDFGGPFFIKSSRLRKAPITKSYISIFVCMTTKAIHIELVSNLSTEAFVACLKRFIARRGNPSIIYSDNATNFQGAKNQLYELYQFFQTPSNSDSIKDFLAHNQTEWKFIPPKSPHWGGIWESAIKSAKFHMLRLVGNAHLTYEELNTVLTQIEAILNSRPLCALSNDPTDLQSLTPGHFLIGTSLTAFPEKDICEIPENRLSFWNKCSQIQQLFWKRWLVEYLNRLQHRPKWLVPFSNVKVNDVVLFKDNDNSYPLKWPLARIIETIPGPDGKVRMVMLKTADGIYKRPIVKICPLPSNGSFQNL